MPRDGDGPSADSSLLGIAPMVGFWFSRMCGRVPGGVFAGRAIAAVVLVALGVAMVRGWGPELAPFTAWRGTESRRVLLVDPDPKPDAVPGIPGLRMDRAKGLILACQARPVQNCEVDV